MNLTVVSGPALEPVTLAEVKAQLRISMDDEDDLISGYITAAREHVEMFLRRSLINRTYRLRLTDFPRDKTFIELPKPPLVSVSHVKYYDDVNNVLTTFAAANNYSVFGDSILGRVQLLDEVDWPEVYEREDAVQIEFVAGYGAAAANVPQSIRLAVRMLVSHWYENRVPVNIGNIVNPLPHHINSLLWAHRVVSV